MSTIYLVVLTAYILLTTYLKSEGSTVAPGIIQYCGSNLSNILREICESLYNTYPTTTFKRSVPPLDVFKRKEDAISFVMFRRRRKRGVVDECCKKSCSKRELSNYCAK